LPLFAILTLFPEALEAYVRESILAVARDKGLARILLVDFRDFARDRHRTVDDRPFGGGPGMVLRPEPIVECVEWLEKKHGRFRKVLLCPSGTTFRQPMAEALAREERVLLIAGRYEGFDARIRAELELEEISLGDFVLSGGELPALAVVEAAIRLIPGVLGDERSALEDSFRTTESGPGALDHPQFTRPRVFRGRAVPDVLLSGDHEAIRRWRERAAADLTLARRPDLVAEIPTDPISELGSGPPNNTTTHPPNPGGREQPCT
jgi:tRNA (guanine37-N1)-methyltransferase